VPDLGRWNCSRADDFGYSEERMWHAGTVSTRSGWIALGVLAAKFVTALLVSSNLPSAGPRQPRDVACVTGFHPELGKCVADR